MNRVAHRNIGQGQVVSREIRTARHLAIQNDEGRHETFRSVTDSAMAIGTNTAAITALPSWLFLECI
jgi:hypothetical protein